MKTLLTVLSASAVLVASTAAHAQCTTNADCKGSRVCVKGACQEAAPQRCTRDTDCSGDLVCSAGTCAAPKAAGARSQPPRSPAYRVMLQRITGLWLSGLITLPIAYVTTIGVVAGVSGDRDRGEAVGYASIPLFGPLVMLGSDLDTDDYTAPLVMSAILQIVGAALLVTGLVYKHEVRLPTIALGETDESPRLSILPSPVGRSGFGLSLSLLDF